MKTVTQVSGMQVSVFLMDDFAGPLVNNMHLFLDAEAGCIQIPRIICPDEG
jgi:hypothetical protein